MRPLRLIRTPWPSRRSAGSLCGAPAWWQRGWPRQRVGSVAEAELLAPLAELLMPQMPIAELFRSFPSPKGWGGNYLEPDLAAYGVLKDANAALFVEYDGYWRHGEKEGMERDRMKNAALLKYAPKGSYVVRISHTISSSLQDNTVLWVRAQPWRSDSPAQTSKIHYEVITQTLSGLKHTLCPKVMERFRLQSKEGTRLRSASVIDFMKTTKFAKSGNTLDEISVFLRGEGFGTKELDLMLEKAIEPGMSIDKKLRPVMRWFSDLGMAKIQVARVVSRRPKTLGLSLQQNLQPTVQWFLDLGLTKSQVAKAVATYPQILGLSIQQNLKPTVQWFLELGLTKNQVAKAVATYPHILGLSIEQNLKPTVQWFLELGLTKNQVAKAVATYPHILGLSIEQNLKPTVQWFLELGLTKNQVAKAVATHPNTLGLSIEQNLKPTVQWFLELGLTKNQVAKAVATYPQILGLSIEQNLKPTVQWLLDLGMTKNQVAQMVSSHPPILWYSIEKNLSPTVQWLLDLGLTKNQVATAVATNPQILGLSIEKNLSPKMLVLNDFYAAQHARDMVAKWPQLLGYSYERLTTRLKILAEQDKIDKLTSAMPLTEETFQRRFLDGKTKDSRQMGPCDCVVGAWVRRAVFCTSAIVIIVRGETLILDEIKATPRTSISPLSLAH